MSYHFCRYSIISKGCVFQGCICKLFELTLLLM